MEFLAVLLTILLTRVGVLHATEHCTTGFSVVAPELAVPGKTTAVFVTLHGPDTLVPINVTLRLVSDSSGDENPETALTTQEIRGHGIIPLVIPSDALGSHILQTLVNCTGNEACALQSTSQMRLVGPVRDVIIRPAKHAYSPGETISFWVLALDHDLQIATGAIGTISVKDPAGTKVALWDQVTLDEGIKAFSLPLSEYVRSGKWLLHVEVESAEFSAPIEIAPGVGNGLPDVAAAEEHYVELRFGREMRRRYKPGLPFSGKVEAMSTEKSVRVRVKVYDNTTSIYSQDIEITAGEGTFVVPAIMADSDVIALQAELVSVESKEIESHYVLAREPIQKWNSSSDCYLLIEGVEHTLQPEEEAHVTILSTCPCERDLHYVITTDGRVTDWAQRRYEDPMVHVTPSEATGEVCRLNFSFTVKSIMAPVSQLLVYYVTPQGEPVSDVISFDVKLLHKQVYVSLEERNWWLPNQAIDLEVVAEPSSLVCLLGGRSTNNDVRFDPRISDEREPLSITGEVDFLEAGVSFFQRQCVQKNDSEVSGVSYRQSGSGAGPSNRRRPQESLIGGVPYDQLWLWKCFNYTLEIASSGITITSPQEAGKWTLWALTISSSGLRFSSAVNIQVFRPLQVDFHLPPNLKVRETLEVDIRIGNNINSCMDVTALLALSEGAQFTSNGLLYVTERLRLGPHGATSLVVRLLVTTPGLKNMTVEVNGYTSPSCEGAENTSVNTTLAGAVIRSATVKVQPEGLVRTDTESVYFCANENVIVSTADNFRYEWIQAPKNRNGIIVEVKAGAGKKVGPIYVGLAESRQPTDRMYRITVGDEKNTMTWIGRGKHGYGIQLTSAPTPGILSEDEWRTLWITWERNTIAIGNGSSLYNNTLLKWKMDKKLKIQHVGFASAWGSDAEFRVWNFNEEAGFSQVLHLETPKSVVPGSESGELIIAGGLTPPNLRALNNGGGLSESLASLTSLLTADLYTNRTELQTALRSLPKYVQTILAYRKMDNSFSEHQMLGSHKSTIQVLEALIKIQPFYNVDPELIQSVKSWVQLRQEDDGSFMPLPADVKISYASENFRANVSSELRLMEHISEITAETIITLYEIGIENDADAETLQKAKIYLENTLPKVKSSEAIAAVTLALVLVKSATAAWAVEKLRNASTTEENEFGWPHFTPKRDAANWLYETESGKPFKEPLLTTAEEFRASVYALSTFCLVGDLKFAESAAKYIYYRSHMLDTHSELLYPTVKAFWQYGKILADHQMALTISLATSGMELTDTVVLKTNQSPQTLHLPSLPTKVFVYATGAGCATIQGKTSYSTYSVKSSSSLLEISSEVIQEILPDRSSVEEIEGKSPVLKIRTCFKWKDDKPSGVLRMEVELFSGFELTSVPPYLLNPQENMTEMLHGYSDNNLWFIFANVTGDCPICVQYSVRSVYVISSLRPSYTRIYPVGREDFVVDTFFHTQIGSNLLKDITEDDLITWFKANDTTTSNSFSLSGNCEYSTLMTTLAPSTTVKSDFMTKSTTESSVVNLNDLDVVTYTINVDNESEANVSTKIEETTIAPETTTSANLKKLVKSPNKEGKQKKYLKNILPHYLTMKTKRGDSKANKLNNSTEATNIVNAVATSKPVEENVTKHTLEIISLPKYVNTQIHDVPKKIVKSKNDEETPATFAPEIKNDKYILLDKEELWGILKEVVNDKVNKNSSKILFEKFRS